MVPGSLRLSVLFLVLLSTPFHLSADATSPQARLVKTLSLPGRGRHIAFAPHDEMLATTSTDGTIQLFRLPRCELVRTIKHAGGATSVAFNPDGQSLVTAGYDHTLRIWRITDGRLLRTLPGHAGTVWTVAFSPDGSQVASGGEDNLVKLWRASDGALVRELRGHSRNVWSVAFSPDGRRLVSGSFDRAVRVWDVASGATVHSMHHAQAVVSVAWSPDGRWIASAGDDSTVRIWRARDYALAHELTGGAEHVYAVAFSGDGAYLVAGGRERGAFGTLWKQVAGLSRGEHGRSVRLWRVRDGKLQRAIADHADEVMGVAFSLDGRMFATSSDDRSVKVYLVEPGFPQRSN
jgi:WD40 repeat protein